jgi:hypothetical protein
MLTAVIKKTVGLGRPPTRWYAMVTAHVMMKTDTMMSTS